MTDGASRPYLFVCGCPRSGTTALTRLLSAHEDIALGIERFGHLVSAKRFKLSPKHFEKDRFFHVKRGDTFYQSLKEVAGGNYYNELAEKYDSCMWVGDKRPDLYMSYSQLQSAFPNAVVLFIFRNIFDVAQSYKARALNAEDDWPEGKGVMSAISDWNDSLNMTLAAQQTMTIHCIQYERLFAGEDLDIAPIFKPLGISNVKRPQSFFDNRLKLRAQVLEAERGAILTSDEKRDIATHADFAAYRDLMTKGQVLI